jgi:hypothetical protein
MNGEGFSVAGKIFESKNQRPKVCDCCDIPGAQTPIPVVCFDSPAARPCVAPTGLYTLCSTRYLGLRSPLVRFDLGFQTAGLQPARNLAPLRFRLRLAAGSVSVGDVLLIHRSRPNPSITGLKARDLKAQANGLGYGHDVCRRPVGAGQSGRPCTNIFRVF